jgi:uncharacterized protein (DUF427 family)
MNATALAQKAPGFVKNPDKFLEVDPSPRRVRVKFAGETIVDTTSALLMCEGGHVPIYYFPMADVRMDLFTATDNASHCGYKGHASYWTLTVGDRVEENVMWSYRDPYEEMLGIKDHVAFYWDRMESWWEEDEEIFKHARDPKHRVDAILSHRPVTVVVGGEALAETSNARFVFETNHPVRYYIPREDVRMDPLSGSDTTSRCPYKGIASYFSAAVGEESYPDIAWSYQNPIEECPKIRDLICFFNENVDAIIVDGAEVDKPATKWSKK